MQQLCRRHETTLERACDHHPTNTMITTPLPIFREFRRRPARNRRMAQLAGLRHCPRRPTPGGISARPAQGAGLSARRALCRRGHYALRQHDSGRTTARVSRRPRGRAPPEAAIRWNAMAMVVRANHLSPGIGGHISTYASAATLYEVAFNHFFHGKEGASRPIRYSSRGTPRRASTRGRFCWAGSARSISRTSAASCSPRRGSRPIRIPG